MKYDKFSRRHFLIGSGAFTLALPHLVSLMPKAHAQTLNNKFFVFMNTGHGALNQEHWAPRNFPAGTKTAFNLGSGYWNGYYAKLTDVAAGGDLTQLWQASFITPYLSKMNIIEGLDIGVYLGHHRGLLGTYHNADQLDQSAIESTKWNSLDYFLSQSKSFDPSGSHKLVVTQTGEQQSFYYNASGSRIDCQQVTGYTQDVFKTLFPNNGSTSNVATTTTVDQDAVKRKSIIDRVLSSYNGVLNSAYGPGKRISYHDKLVVQEHIDGMRDLEKKITSLASTSSSSSSASCNALTTPSNVRISYDYAQIYNQASEKVKWDIITDMMVNAIRCGASRLWSLPLDNFNTFPVNDFHQEIPHMHTDAGVQQKILSNYRNAARDIYTLVLKKLNSSTGANGGTLLDQGLVVWSHESGRNTHDNDNTPVVTAGSAGGYFKTGYHVNYIDYTRTMYGDWNGPQGNPGIHYNRWLANIAMSMGASPSEFEKNGQRGYGPFGANWHFGSNNSSAPTYATYRSDLSKPLPFIVA